MTTKAELSRAKLRAYQKRMAQFMADTNRCALWADMGLGKTVATLTALAELDACCEFNRALVVAPLRVAKHTWPDEIAVWDHIDLEHTLLAGLEPKERIAALQQKTKAHIINRELFPWLVKQCETNRKWPYDLVVLDESSSFSDHQSAGWKAAVKIRPYTPRLIELTGTPAANGLTKLWAQVALLDRGDRLGRTITEFRRRYCFQDYNGYDWEIRPGGEEEIHAQVADICLSMRAEDYLELPPLVNNVIKVQLPANARRKYREMEKQFVTLVGDTEITAANAGVLTGKLQQVANGFIFDEHRTAHLLHDAKLQALKEIVDGAEGNPLLVGYTHVPDRERILKAFPQAELFADDPTTLARWNAGKIPILVGHPQSIGHGLSMQHGGHILVWYGIPWSLEHYLQMLERIGPTRQAQSGYDRTVIVHHIVAEQTIDDDIMATSTAGGIKDVTQRALLRAVRDGAKRRV